MIEKCALGVITERGKKVLDPTWSNLGDHEEDFLRRHIDEVRATATDEQTRGRFRPDSSLESDLMAALDATEQSEFVDIAKRLVQKLATAMLPVAAKASCVVALIVSSDGDGKSVTLLKLDAEIEAARLMQIMGEIRLEVFDDLLPSPGEIQKGISWPDPRQHSDLIIRDKQAGAMAGTAQYFLNAYKIDASPTAKLTEQALVKAMSVLAPSKVADAVAAAGDGGSANDVITRIHQDVPELDGSAKALGGHGAIPGIIRPSFATTSKQTYEAHGIELKVPLAEIGRVTSRQEGTVWVTEVRTDLPLVPATSVPTFSDSDTLPGSGNGTVS
ncbi:hypothetical protein [Curtobacterium sp. CFBP9011]|uniref:hypothetical protein n=1 Tax=Curtobacterium sp. CFBP9011 TaxID=3096530 RepID=UPI002A6A54AD|nr:hypothetical protein [Curtobacterium sp. CFBP9011]MDY1004697.1 hypothetical protein [Curtobacterium sp. CFBP9011]